MVSCKGAPPGSRVLCFCRAGGDEIGQFEQFVRSHPAGHVLQTPQWGEVKALTGWRPHCFWVKERGRPVASALVLERPLPVLGSPLFYSPRGPVADLSDTEVLGAMVGGVRRFARERGAVLWKVDPAVARTQAVSVRLSALGFRLIDAGQDFESVQPRFVMRLDLLGRSPDDILADMHSKTRYNIRLSSRRGVDVRIARDEGDIERFYSILRQTARRDGFAIRDLGYFTNLWKVLAGSGLARLFLAEYEGDLLAGAFCLHCSRRVRYLYGASSNDKRNLMASYAVQWAAIRWAKEEDCVEYDFRGVSGNTDPGHPLYGLYRFKQGFGADMVELAGEYDLVLRPLLYAAWRVGEPLYRRLRDSLSR